MLDRRALLAFVFVGCDGGRDRLIEAQVQRAEVICADRRIRFDRELGNRLTYVAVVVNNLRNGESLSQKVETMLAGARVNCGIRCSRTQRFYKLLQEQGNTMFDFCVARRRNRSRCHLRSTARDDFFSVDGDELVQHEAGLLSSMMLA